MTVLYNPNLDNQEDNVPFINPALKTGLIGGVALIIMTMAIMLLKINMFSIGTSIMMFLVMAGIYFGITSWGNINHRSNDLNGFMTFKRAFLLAFVTMVVMSVIGNIFNYLYYNVINPGAVEEMVEQMRAFMEQYNLPEEKIEESVAQIQQSQSGAGIAKGLVSSLVMSAIGALIVGAITKKNKPVFS